jgi:transcriptional regulator with XRE-family HTH domain
LPPAITKPLPTKRTRSAFHYPSVDPTSAERLLEIAHLGQRIRRLRLRRSMGLVELGKLTGLSASFLSQLETGRVVPTLRNLARIALVFKKDLSYFFEPEEASIFRVQRRKDRVRLSMGSPEPDYIAESFGILVPEGGMRPCMAEFLPGEEREPFFPEKYAGVEMCYVLSGSVEFDRNGERHVLNARDMMYVSGETERSYHCSGKEPVHALIISFDEDSPTERRARRRSS